MTVAVYRFGDFQLDCGRFEILKNGQPIRIERKPLELLILLLANEGRLVTRTEIAERLWSKDVFVDTEHGINTAIRKIRQVLGDDPESPRFVQTVTGKGYRFAMPITTIPVLELTATLTEPAPVPLRRKAAFLYFALGVLAVCAILVLAFYRTRGGTPQIAYTQITDFTDSAVAPALSPDGHMLAFIRGDNSFLNSGPIYLKVLPDGEPRRITDDPRPKYGLAFSPDGARIAYTVADPSGFSTYFVPVLGSDPHLLLNNAAGLVWLDPNTLLFSEFKSGIHLGVVTASETRSGLREIYFPAHQRGMAHNAFPSPDRRWALVVEMNAAGDWDRCRLIALNGGKPPQSVGPQGACTSAGWSPDGSWMYFTATVQGSSHIWRQLFPNGKPQQITFGPTDEQGIAIEPRGRSLITSIGVQESSLWIHAPGGDRQLSTEGKIVTDRSPPSFTPDGTAIYYLWRRRQPNANVELWRVSVDSGKSDAVLPGIPIVAYDISADDKRVVYETSMPGGTTQLWLAPIDRSSPPRKIGGPGATQPHFAAESRILFLQNDGKMNYLEQMNPDDSNPSPSKVVPYPIDDFQGVSPNARWAIAAVPNAQRSSGANIMAIPLNGGNPRRVCTGYCSPKWSTDGQFLFIPVESASLKNPGRSLAIPVGPEENLSVLPLDGIDLNGKASVVPGARTIDHDNLIPGKDPEHFAYVKVVEHRNLYRVSLH